MSDGFANSVVGGTTLVRQAISSPNFVTQVSGWTINQDGSAEFNNITIRGGSIVNGATLIYNGTPAAGNLIIAMSQAGGTDAFGNAYGPGIWVRDQSAGIQVFDINPSNGIASFGPQTNAVPGAAIDPIGGQARFTSIYGTAPGTSSTENWNSMSIRGYQHSWTDSGSGPAGQYRLIASPAKCAELVADLTAGTTTDGTVIINLPNAYHPLNPQIFPVVLPGAAAGNYYLTAQANGNLTCTGMAALTNPRVVIPAGTLISLDA